MTSYFSLSGKFTPEDITSLLDIQPMWVQRIGDPGPPGAIGLRRGAEWCWQPTDDDSDDIGDQLAYLAGALSMKRETVADLSKKFNGTLYLYNDLQTVSRNWFLSAQTVGLIAGMNLHIEFRIIPSTQKAEIKNDAH